MGGGLAGGFEEEVCRAAGGVEGSAEAVAVGGGGVVREDCDGVEEFQVAVEGCRGEMGRAGAVHSADAANGGANVGFEEVVGEVEDGDAEAVGDLGDFEVWVEVEADEGVEVGLDWCLGGIHGGRIR